MNMSKQYNHDPRHFRFPRTMENTGYAIQDCTGQSRLADKIVFIGALAILLLLMVALPAWAQQKVWAENESEQTKCYGTLTDDRLGLGKITVGTGIDLCAGTRDATKTLACFVRAYHSKEVGGFGLPLGLAIKLCKSAGE